LTSGRHVRHIVNTNDLVGRVPWINGIKSGHTGDAGYVLVSEGTRHGLTLISAVLGTSSLAARNASALALLNWGFAEYRLVQLVRRGQPFVRRWLPYQVAPALIVAARGYRTVLGRGARVRLEVGRLRRLGGPMARGTVVGQLRIEVSGRPTVLIPLILAGGRLRAVSAPSDFGHHLGQPFTLLMLALLIGGAAAAVTRRWRRPRALALCRVEER
ncbi:MAG: hypothetical protein KGL15_04075, partial [Acidobacteriota bacterium]|nr:hypothetical protein [Acidobacteriota bacterium]